MVTISFCMIVKNSTGFVLNDYWDYIPLKKSTLLRKEAHYEENINW